uniref:Ring finger protein 4 n=1 Tax=Fundulus heteroclitus TaxID=8078 RepID=A0A3Q2P946_FUNHE
MSSSAQRKRKPTGSSLPSRTKTSRTANSRTLALRTDGVGDPTPPSDPTDTLDSLEEVVDLTREGSEAAVVDLTTANDSVLVTHQTHSHNHRVPPGQSYVLSSDDDEDGAIAETFLISSRLKTAVLHPDWLLFPSQIVDSGRLVVSTKCGHVFCSQCLRDALAASHTCPTCRKRLTARQYHPLYI